MRLVAQVLAWLVAVATVLLVVEGGLRLVGLGPHPSPVDFDAAVGWANRPDAAGTLEGREFTARWRTDGRGLRVTPRARDDAGAAPVLLLGDSFVFGTAADEHDTIAARLQRAWDEEGRRLVALNGGVLGWDTGQAVRWLEEHGAALRPRAVVLFAYENDLYWNTQTEYASADGARPKVRIEPGRSADDPERPSAEPPHRPWWKGTALGKTVGNLVLGAHPPRRLEAAGRELDAELVVVLPEAGDPELSRSVDEHTLAALVRLRAACERLGCDALLVTLPAAPLFEEDWRATYERRGLAGLDWSCDRPVERFLSLADAAGLTALDATTALRARRSEAPDERLYWREDWHLTPAGNEAVARAVAAFLTDRIDTGEPGPRGAAPVPHDSPWPTRAIVWLVLSGLVASVLQSQPQRGALLVDVLGAGAMVALVMTLLIGGHALVGVLPARFATALVGLVLVVLLGFVVYHLRDRFGTIGELLSSFARRGHWYLMPALVVLVGVGSLLIVAASSPLVAPFVYTLF